MTYRERRTAKADRLREWADKRETKAEAAFARSDAIADMVPFGQPILSGHHSEGRHRRDLDRIRTRMSQGLEHSQKAVDFRRRADGIETAAARAIYTDDPDAVERLTVKLEILVARRTRIKAFNAAARRGTPDLSILTESERDEIATLARVAAYQLSTGGGFPAYALSNLGATIRKEQARLAGLLAREEE